MTKFNLYYLWGFLFFFFFLILSIMCLFFIFNDLSFIVEWVLLNLNSCSLVFVVYLDYISLSFSAVVLLISSLVILYSSEYMGAYNFSSLRFLFLVVLFVFSMLLMIFSPNLISIILGWDGLGLVSYCLVIYYNSLSSYLAGLITCLTNRLGDIGLLISISWVLSFGSWNFIFYLDYMDSLIFFMVILSSFTKSAQIPFSCWLPAAMAAPTPVSSLVHSSTLVTAGVYLLIRFHSLIFLNTYFLYISFLTMLMASFCANFEYDLSKIIALSTLSQLGLMMVCLFLGFSDLCFFHLLSHAMFKSLLFLCSGIMIHLLGDNQDIRLMGCLSLSIPYVCMCFNLANFSLFGVPFLSGFYSKDLILEVSVFEGMGLVFFLLFYFSLSLTASYSLRLMYYTMFKSYTNLGYVFINDNFSMMKFSIIFLTFFSLCFGCLYSWLTNLFSSFLMFPFSLSVFSLIMLTLGLIFGYEIYFLKFWLPMLVYHLNGYMWFMMGYSNFLYTFFFSFSLFSNVSLYWGEYFGANGIMVYLFNLINFSQFYFLSSLRTFMVLSLIWFLILI
nr:NADH dehydrogenase subunit 5 [Acinopterus sp.]